LFVTETKTKALFKAISFFIIFRTKYKYLFLAIFLY
jgi:hypothetical protein